MCNGITLLVPPLEMMGRKKAPCDVVKLWQWIFDNVAYCEYAILSIDTLAYGNIINSRIHQKSMSDIDKCLDNVKMIKRINPSIKIHALNLVTRVAAYDSSDEDPDYWDVYGNRIWEYCRLTHRIEEKIDLERDNEDLIALKKDIPEAYISDFLARRKKNRYINLCAIDLVSANVIDYLVIPKDDCAEFGFASMDHRAIVEKIFECGVQTRVLIYPGADEVGSVLFVRVFNHYHGIEPRVFLRYSSTNGPFCIPKYEDRQLHESVKYQITSAGGVIVNSEMESDMLLAIHSPWATHTMEAAEQAAAPFAYKANINIPEFVNYIGHYSHYYKKAYSIADVVYCNGADDTFMRYASLSGLFDKVCGYGGWNTSQNTIGVALAHGMLISYYGMFEDHSHERGRMLSIKFLLRKIVEDWMHQYKITNYVYNNLDKFGIDDPYAINDGEQRVTQEISALMNEMIKETFGETFHGKKLRVANLVLPWKRLFETDFDVIEV